MTQKSRVERASSPFAFSGRGAAPSAAVVGAVAPSWLEQRLDTPELRVLDVRLDADAHPRLLRRSAEGGGQVDLRSWAHLGAPPLWRATGSREPRHAGPSRAYLAGHVPGAVALDVRAALFDDAGEVVSAPELAMVMSSLGVSDEGTVVIVDEGRPDAALAAAWALVRYGHRDVHVLEGGFARWTSEGRAVTRTVVRHPPASFTARVTP